MRPKTYIRLLLVILVASASFILLSYSRKNTDANTDGSTECGGKGCEKKVQSDFILWESLTRNLLSARG
jgi:hypothetical protein